MHRRERADKLGTGTVGRILVVAGGGLADTDMANPDVLVCVGEKRADALEPVGAAPPKFTCNTPV